VPESLTSPIRNNTVAKTDVLVVVFERQSAQGPNWLILGVVLAGIWFAVTGGLNELFS